MYSSLQELQYKCLLFFGLIDEFQSSFHEYSIFYIMSYRCCRSKIGMNFFLEEHSIYINLYVLGVVHKLRLQDEVSR